MTFPKLSIIIPTLNAQKVLSACLKSIKKQTFKKYQIIIADGGSTDKTLQIARKYNCKVIKNPLKTAEAGKMVALKKTSTKYVALIDSDNILPTKDWLQNNIDILESNPKLVGTEPISFTYRPNAGFIERYSALIGANDPYAFVTGVYDRQNHINYRWTGLKIDQIDKEKYIKIKLQPQKPIPTIGANGTIFRHSFLKPFLDTDYFFDIDIISRHLQSSKRSIFFAKTKQGIIHTFCESSVKKFIKKQRRRIVDYFSYQKLRHFNWSQTNQKSSLKFILYTLLILPMFIDMFIGFIHTPDPAWFFHPFACFITLFIYSTSTLKQKLGLLKGLDRNQWQQ
ncbi:MAG TPA: glycosyltransferase family 2 protein [Candidatus Woesebacteria bacterium]|jgi:glycosyltransferase involved in cell wall biosynthesis|nr:glycosyltransferase family 2 protein [Candidatus Shapirobacteria bacterium]HOR02183.1 glycosyltransferase family 2 protein [Candidatus Woesebacteria bacterium]